MTYSFSGKLVTSKATSTSMGPQNTTKVSTPLFDVHGKGEEIEKFLPATAIKLRVHAKDKTITEFGTEMLTTASKSTKDGTFMIVTFRNEHTKANSKLPDMVGEELNFTVSLEEEGDDLGLAESEE